MNTDSTGDEALSSTTLSDQENSNEKSKRRRKVRVAFAYYCTVVLQAQFAAGGHFVWNIKIKYFYNPSYNKAILCESSIILPVSYWYRSKEDIFHIFFSF
jgi:hypothetical protein